MDGMNLITALMVLTHMEDEMIDVIEHDGKGFPEHLRGKWVIAIFRDRKGLQWGAELAEYWIPDENDASDYWTHGGSNNDIVGYVMAEEPT